jgi:predicted transcriptional regulator
MKIKYLLCPEVLACQRKDSLATAARRMHTGRVSALAVCIGADPVGVISESDLARAVAQLADPQSARVDAHMTLIVHTAEPEEDCRAVAQRMLDLGIQHMPVINDGTLVNVVSVRQLFSVDTRLVDAGTPGAGANTCQCRWPAAGGPRPSCARRSASPRPAGAGRQMVGPSDRRSNGHI